MKEINMSIICVFNNEKKLNEHLIKSINNQNVTVELILLDNRKKEYCSAAQALNLGAKKAHGKHLLFVHQDIEFLQKDALYQIWNELEKKSNQILGVAGIVFNQKGVYSSMVHGKDKENAGLYHIDKTQKIDILDECLMACSKEIFDKIWFDDKTCNGWDLYMVDFCLQASLKNIEIEVIPLSIWHVSPGYPKHPFYVSARKLVKKYQKSIPYVQSCCITVPIPTNILGIILLYLLESVNNIRSAIKG